MNTCVTHADETHVHPSVARLLAPLTTATRSDDATQRCCVCVSCTQPPPPQSVTELPVCRAEAPPAPVTELPPSHRTSDLNWGTGRRFVEVKANSFNGVRRRRMSRGRPGGGWGGGVPLCNIWASSPAGHSSWHGKPRLLLHFPSQRTHILLTLLRQTLHIQNRCPHHHPRMRWTDAVSTGCFHSAPARLR